MMSKVRVAVSQHGSHKHFGMHFLGNVWMCFNEVAHYQVHVTLMTFSRSWVQRWKSQAALFKNALFQLSYT